MTIAKRVHAGSAHGRFQPLHNEHLRYLLEAKKRCEFLWIGITKFDTSGGALNPLGRHRERPLSNPLTYIERVGMIGETLRKHGISEAEFAFIPFPIETPATLPHYLEQSVRCFTTICDDWNIEKIAVLEAAGYEVEVLWDTREKVVTSTEIRRQLAAGETGWRSMVPETVCKWVDDLDIASRLRGLSD